jgi:hypothetical protein
MEVRRLDPESGFVDALREMQRTTKQQATRPAGTIFIQEKLHTIDPATGVETIFGQLPDGSVGFQPFIGDTVPPPIPTSPLAVTQVGTVILTWDGQFSPSAEAPKDFQFCRIYARQTAISAASFPASSIPSTDILLGSVMTPNDSIIVGSNVVTSGLPYIFYATSVDYNLNESDTSTSTADVVIASMLDDAGLSAEIGAVLTTANGKNTITYSSAAASGSGIKAGDVWFQTNGSNIIIGQWQWSGSSWISQTIDDVLIANINAGKIVAGTINAVHVAIGSGHNALPDPGFNSPDMTNARTAQSTGGTAGWTVSNGTSTGLRKATRTTGTTSDVFNYLTSAHTFANAGQLIPCVAGQVWTLKSDTSTSASAALVTFQAYTASADGTVATTTIASTSISTTAQRSVSATYTIPDGVTGFNVGLKCDTTGITWSVYGNAYVGQQVTGDLIVNGAIDGKTITGATIQTAASGARLVLDTTSLKGYDSTGANYLTADSSGVSVSGVLNATGTGRDPTSGGTRPIDIVVGKDAAYWSIGTESWPSSPTHGTSVPGISFRPRNDVTVYKYAAMYSETGSNLILTSGLSSENNPPGGTTTGNMTLMPYQALFDVPVISPQAMIILNKSAAQTLTTANTFYDIGWDVVPYTNLMTHSPTTNNHQITIQKSGVYTITFKTAVNQNTGQVSGAVTINGTLQSNSIQRVGNNSGQFEKCGSTQQYVLNSGDVITIQVSSGVAGALADSVNFASIKCEIMY